jgi:hypothetical protein
MNGLEELHVEYMGDGFYYIVCRNEEGGLELWESSDYGESIQYGSEEIRDIEHAIQLARSFT